MFDTNKISDLAKKLSESLPAGFTQMQQELERNFYTILQATFAKLNLVTREEFDVQAGVLARTRAKLEALEQKVRELEIKLEEKR